MEVAPDGGVLVGEEGQIEFFDPEGQQVLRMESLSSELTLLKAARLRLDLGLTRITGLAGDIVVDADGC